MLWNVLGLALVMGAPVAALPDKTEEPKKQETPEKAKDASKAESPSKVTPPPYLLASEDVISISVVNFPNLSVVGLVVPPDGKISVTLLEPISVTGKTVEELAQVLAEKWDKYVVKPSVTVSLVQKRKENVMIYGFVGRAGTLEYKNNLHILEVLAEVGGAPPTGDLTRVTVTHKDGLKQMLDLSHPETKGGTDQDILLQVGDVIYVPERRTQLNVIGEVNRPGSFDYKEDMTVLDALTAAGGIRETADLTASTLIHNGKEGKLDLESLLRRGDISINIKLSAGDRILVPEIRNRTYVFGAIARPGFYIFKDGDRVLDALNGLGGPTQNANLAKINVIRIDKTKNTAAVQEVNLDKFLKKGDTKGNVALGPGDVLFIPDKKRGFRMEDLFGILSGVNLINGLGSIFNGRLGR